MTHETWEMVAALSLPAWAGFGLGPFIVWCIDPAAPAGLLILALVVTAATLALIASAIMAIRAERRNEQGKGNDTNGNTRSNR